jgi:hypothetical protein
MGQPNILQQPGFPPLVKVINQSRLLELHIVSPQAAKSMPACRPSVPNECSEHT